MLDKDIEKENSAETTSEKEKATEIESNNEVQDKKKNVVEISNDESKKSVDDPDQGVLGKNDDISKGTENILNLGESDDLTESEKVETRTVVIDDAADKDKDSDGETVIISDVDKKEKATEIESNNEVQNKKKNVVKISNDESEKSVDDPDKGVLGKNDDISKGTENILNLGESDDLTEPEKVEAPTVVIDDAADKDKESDEETVKNSDADKVVKDIEKAEPENSSQENITESSKINQKIQKIDFTDLSLEDLVVEMEGLIHKFPLNEIKKHFELLKSDFSKKFKNFIDKKKEEFIKDGGNEIDFSFFLPAKTKFNEIVNEYKRKRQKHYNDIEKEQKENLENKLQLINDLKELIDNADPSTMYKNFRLLQTEWRDIGQIPHNKYNDVWRTYQHHVERFYDLLHLNNDFRDLDFKHNLEEKSKLVERAEKLAIQKDANQAFKELQILHRMWKEDMGPVARDVREEIWGRFSDATKKIHDKRHEYQNELDIKYKANVALKLEVIEKIKSFSFDSNTSHKSWQNGIKNMEKLRNEFFVIGRVPRSKNEDIWQLFKDATKKFNRSKNTFYKSIKKDQLENFAKKMQLVEEAEAMKNSDDWSNVTNKFKNIQSEWKNIGHVPRKDSDRIWKRFKDACNHYFDQFHNMQDGSNKDQVEVLNKKIELLDEFKDQINQEVSITIDSLQLFVEKWKKLGGVPAKMRQIGSKFNKVIDLACKKLNLGKEETVMLKFKMMMDTYVEQKDHRKIDNELLFVRRKIDELTKEIKLLENNIGFISNATKDNPLIANIYKNIENYKDNVKIWHRKLTYMKQLEY